MALETLMHDTATVDDPTPTTLAVGRAALEAALSPAATQQNHAVITRRRRPRARRWAVATSIAAAVTGGLLLGPTFNLLGSRSGASADAAPVLLRAGVAAGAQPGGWPNAEYWHSVATIEPGTTSASYQRQIWIGHHNSGVLEDPSVDSGALALGVAAFPAGARGLSWDQLYGLPTESHALETALRAGIHGAGPDDDSELYTIVGDLLRESPAPPALREALWEVAARIPGVSLIGTVTDGAGRQGVAVQRGGLRYVLDPSDGRLLEEVDGGLRTTYIEQGPATSAPAATSR